MLTDSPELLAHVATDLAPGLEKAFARRPMESSYRVENISGDVPEFIRGTYYLNGPAAFSHGGLRYQHWLDGDGMVCRLSFSNEEVHFANRFVRTTKFVREEQSGRPIFRAFGTAFPGDQLNRGVALVSPANVSVYPFHDTLLAFGEQALPWQLNPHTLETYGTFDFAGALTEISPFAAHPKFDARTGEMFNFGVFFSPGSSKLCLYRCDGSGKLHRLANHAMEHPFSIHDFALSSRYLVFYISPYLLDVEAMVRGNQSLMDSLQWRSELGSQIQVFSRSSGERVASVRLPGRYCLHLINCFEQENMLSVDVIELERPIYDQYRPVPDFFTDVPSGGPVRLVIDLKTQNLLSRHELRYRKAPDFPAISPALGSRPYTDFWMLGLSQAGEPGRKFFDELVHARWNEAEPSDIYRAQPGCFLGGEPVFIANPASSEGAVICQNFDAAQEESSFLIFNADTVGSGPVAKIRLRKPIHFGFHAVFNPATPQPQ